MGFTDDNLDILQNIEAIVIDIYRKDYPDLKDREVLKAYEALIQHQRQVARGRTPNPPENLSDSEQMIFDAIQQVLEVRRELAPPSEKPQRFSLVNKSTSFEDTLLACLRKVHKSVKFWTKERGPQGYLNYINGFL